MGFFSNLFRGRDAPSNSTAGSGYGFFMGSTASGKRVNARSAMQMTAVYSCVRILSEAVAGLPLQFYRYNDNGGKEKAVDHPLYFLLHDEPNPEMTSFVFRETLMTHLLLWGNAYSQIIRNGKGEIVALYPLMPDRMTVDRDEHGRLYYEYLVYDGDDVDGRTGTDPKANGKIVRLHPADVLHIPGLGFDGLVGYSPIAMAKNAIGLAIAAEEYARLAADDVKKAVKKAGTQARKDIQENAPVKTGAYAKSWAAKTTKETANAMEIVVYSRNRYQLVHLLEFGHALRKGGRTRAFPHIAPAEERAAQTLEREVEKALR